MFQLLILTENTYPIIDFDKYIALAVAFSGLFIFLLQHFLDDIKLLSKKKPLDYCGFKLGDNVIIDYVETIYEGYINHINKQIKCTITHFNYDDKKNIIHIGFMNSQDSFSIHYIPVWKINSIKKSHKSKNHLPLWL